MATAASKTATSPKVVLSTLKTPAEQKVKALDAFLAAEDKADAASKKKGTAKGLLMAVTVHGERITSTDGRAREIQNEVVSTNGWENLARELAAELNLTETQIKRRAKAAGGTRSVKEVKTF